MIPCTFKTEMVFVYLENYRDDADADVTNEIQTISKDPTTGEISLSMGGGTVSDNVDDADANPTNEIQTLSKDPATGDISLTNGGTVADNVDDADADPCNETITGWNTNATTLQINEAGVSHNIGMTPFIDDADASPTNELQTLSINGNIISISNGNSIAVPTGGGGDLWGGQVVESDATLSGDGESSNLLSIAQQGTTNNQVLKWDNVSNTWLPANDDVMDGDASPTNELQDLSIAGNVVSLSGSAQTITLPSNGDDWGTDVALSSSPLSGDGTLGNELSFIDGTTDGHILQWNASSSQWELNTIVNNDNDPLNEIQNLDFTGGILTITNNSAATPIDLNNFDTDEQQLSLIAGPGPGVTWQVSLTSGGAITLPSLGGSLDQAYDYPTDGAGSQIEARDASVVIKGPDGLVVHSAWGGSNFDYFSMLHGYQMYFNPSNGAFRADSSYTGEWRELGNNIGTNSFAVNSGTVASGDLSSAFGSSTSATDVQSFSIGFETLASNDNSFASGENTVASGYTSSAFGSNTSATDFYSFVAGNNNSSNGAGSTTFGNDNQTNGDYSFATGKGLIVETAFETVIGRYNDNSIITSVANSHAQWIGNDPVFVVGNGLSDFNRRNALTIFKDGKVGIGETDLSLNTNSTLFIKGITYGTDYFETGAFFEIPITSTADVGVIKQNGEIIFHTKGTNSVYVGPNSGNLSSVSANDNTALGRNSLGAVTGGSSCTAIGYQSSSSLQNGINNGSVH